MKKSISVAVIALLLSSLPSAARQHSSLRSEERQHAALRSEERQHSAPALHVFESENLHCNDSVLVWTPSSALQNQKASRSGKASVSQDQKANRSGKALSSQNQKASRSGKASSSQNQKASRSGKDSVSKQSRDASMETVRDLPTLILLHGWSGNYRDWNSHIDIQALSDATGFRIICPDGLYDSWYINNADKSKPQWKDFFWNEFWPFMSEKYGLQPDRTFITGLSMGGHGAMSIFLDHPEYFKGAGSMSGVLDLKYSGGSKSYLPKILGCSDIMDPVCVAAGAVARLDAYKAALGEQTQSKILITTCGTEDRNFVSASIDFSQRCRELGIRHIQMLSPGKHRWPYWVWSIRYHLDWFLQVMDDSPIGEGDR